MMKNNDSYESFGNVCDLTYLNSMLCGKEHLVKEKIDNVLKQIPKEQKAINAAISETDYARIKDIAGTMKSSVCLIGVSALTTLLEKIELLAKAKNIEKITEQNKKLNLIMMQAFEELETRFDITN